MKKKLLLSSAIIICLTLVGFGYKSEINKAFTGGGYVNDSGGNQVWFYGTGNLNITGDYETGWLCNVPTTLSSYTNNVGFLTSEVDGSTTNEIQTLSYTSPNLTLSNGGGTVNLKTSTPYSGTSNASGNYTVTYASAYAAIPNVQFNIVGGDPRDVPRLTSSTTTGFTVNVQRRVDVVGLLPTYSNVSGASVGVLVTSD